MFGDIRNTQGERIAYSFTAGAATRRDIVVIAHGLMPSGTNDVFGRALVGRSAGDVARYASHTAAAQAIIPT